jgi:hypothetical protein
MATDNVNFKRILAFTGHTRIGKEVALVRHPNRFKLTCADELTERCQIEGDQGACSENAADRPGINLG